MLSFLIMTIKVSMILWGAVYAYSKLLNPVDAAWISGRPLAMMLLFYAAGLLGHNVWVLYLTMIASLPALARNRAEGAALYVVAIGVVPDLAVLVSAGSVAIITVDKWVCLSLGLLIVFLKSPRGGLRYRGWFDIPFLLIFALDLIQARDQNFTSTMRSLLSSILTMGIPYFVFTRSIGKVEDLRRIMIALALVGFVLAVIGVFEARTHFLVYQQMYAALNVEGAGYRMYKLRGGLLRAVASFGDATSFSLFLALALMATIATRQSFRTTSRVVIALVVISLGIFVTSSRNAWISVGIGVLAFDLYRRRTIALAGKAMLLAMGYAFLSLLAEFSPYINTMMGHSGDTASTTDYRSQLLTRGMEEFWKHPYMGLSIAAVTANLRDLVQGEGIVDFTNGYLLYALTAGVGGLIALVMTFLLPGWAMLRVRRRHSGNVLLDRTAAFVFAVMASTLVNTAFGGTGGKSSGYFYIVLGIAAVLYAWRKVSPELLAASDRKTPLPRSGPAFPVMSLLPPVLAEREVRLVELDAARP